MGCFMMDMQRRTINIDPQSFAEEFALGLRKRVAYTLAERGFYKFGSQLAIDGVGNSSTNPDTEINLSGQIRA